MRRVGSAPQKPLGTPGGVPGAQGGSSTADSGASAPRAAAAPTGALVPRGGGCPGSRSVAAPHSCPLILRPASSPGVSAGRCGKTPPPRARAGVSGMRQGGSAVGQGAVAQLKGRRGLQRGSALAEVQDGRNSPELVLPILLHFPAEMEGGVGKAERSGSLGCLCRGQGCVAWTGLSFPKERRLQPPSLPPCSFPFPSQ